MFKACTGNKITFYIRKFCCAKYTSWKKTLCSITVKSMVNNRGVRVVQNVFPSWEKGKRCHSSEQSALKNVLVAKSRPGVSKLRGLKKLKLKYNHHTINAICVFTGWWRSKCFWKNIKQNVDTELTMFPDLVKQTQIIAQYYFSENDKNWNVTINHMP